MLVGTLSKPSKMPGYGWSIPASMCKVGSKLRDCEGSVCHGCYAMKGRYTFRTVQNALRYRVNKWFELGSHWPAVMSELIERKLKRKPLGERYFRWFDSGDLFNETMLKDIIQVAERLPNVAFWLPTRERRTVRTVLKTQEAPDNLMIRLSDTMVGEKNRSKRHFWTAGVQKATPDEWLQRVVKQEEGAYYCPAPTQKNECGVCRACWDTTVPRVIYKEH